MDEQCLENELNICKVGYESINIDTIIISCRHSYNKYLFKKYDHLDFKKYIPNKDIIDDTFGKWCSCIIMLNSDDSSIIQWKQNLEEHFTSLFKLKNEITIQWTPAKPINLIHAKQLQKQIVSHMKQFIYLSQDLELYNQKRRKLGRFDIIWGKKEQILPSLKEWSDDMTELLYTQDGEIFKKCQQTINELSL